MTDDKNWFAAHLFYGEPWEDLLRIFLKPWVDAHLEPDGIDYFFIRYWEKGPHIRFRMKLGTDQLALKTRLEQDFASYCKKHPSTYEHYSIGQEDLDLVKQNWFANNSLRWIEYEPETDRYGGKLALPACEKHFNYCSEACLNTIAENPDWDYTTSLTAALQMQLLFARACGMDDEQARTFFHCIFISWFPRALGDTRNLGPDQIEQQKTTLLQTFQDQLEQQQEQLLPFIQAIWLESEAAFPELLETYMLDWYNHVRISRKTLEGLYAEDKIVNPGWLKQVNNRVISDKESCLWSLYSSFVHMTNNRLGVQNRDEGYLAFLIKESLGLLTK